MRPVVVAPSILSADFTRLGEEVWAVDRAGADWIHVDVMDGRFVPAISFGTIVLEAVRRSTSKPLNVHLHRTLSRIRELGKKAGAVLDPASPASFVEEVLHLCDVILVMTVNPGAAGQAFLPETLPKIRELRRRCYAKGIDPWIEIDGGQNGENAGLAVEAGAKAVVAGSAILGSGDYAATIARIRGAGGRA